MWQQKVKEILAIKNIVSKVNKKFKWKQIETDFDVMRNDPFFQISKNLNTNNGTNQTMPMFASSHVVSPVIANMILAGTTKSKKMPKYYKRPISAVMTKRMSPHKSVELNLIKWKEKNKDKNDLMNENVKLKTNTYKLESEVKKKDKIIEEILTNQNSMHKTRLNKLIVGIHTSTAMKKHLKDLKQKIAVKDDEIARLK